MFVTQITTHTQGALNRLLTQYKGKPQLAAILSAFVDQIQLLENTIYGLDFGRSVYGSVGAQLDALGTVVDIARNGTSDDEYRLLILGKIGEDTTDATANKTAAVYATLLNAPISQEQDLYPAAVGFSAGGDQTDQNLINIIFLIVQASLGAGIELQFIAGFDPVQGFAFDGPAGEALGFGDATDLTAGGEFGFLLQPDFPFAFESDDPFDGDRGFGSLLDPTAGGNFESL